MAAIKARNGITVEYESFGAADAPAVLLIMGLGMQLTAWPEPFCESIAARGFRVIRFDNRDIGLSTWFDHLGTPGVIWNGLKARLGLRVRSVYTLEDMAADAIGLLDALGIARAHIVGASMGGMIGQTLVSRYPERAASFVSLMSSSGARGLPAPRAEVLRALLGKPADGKDMQSIVDHYLRLFRVIGSPAFPVPEDELRRRIERSVNRAYHPAGSVRQFAAILASGDRSTMLSAIRTRTLVIHGDSDPLVPLAAGEDTARKIPDAELRVIEGMGHDLGAWPLLAESIAAHAASQHRTV